MQNVIAMHATVAETEKNFPPPYFEPRKWVKELDIVHLKLLSIDRITKIPKLFSYDQANLSI